MSLQTVFFKLACVLTSLRDDAKMMTRLIAPKSGSAPCKLRDIQPMVVLAIYAASSPLYSPAPAPRHAPLGVHLHCLPESLRQVSPRRLYPEVTAAAEHIWTAEPLRPAANIDQPTRCGQSAGDGARQLIRRARGPPAPHMYLAPASSTSLEQLSDCSMTLQEEKSCAVSQPLDEYEAQQCTVVEPGKLHITITVNSELDGVAVRKAKAVHAKSVAASSPLGSAALRAERRLSHNFLAAYQAMDSAEVDSVEMEAASAGGATAPVSGAVLPNQKELQRAALVVRSCAANKPLGDAAQRARVRQLWSAYQAMECAAA